MVPAAGAAYGLKQLQANSTALLPNVATCMSGAYVFAGQGHLDPVAGLLVAAAATATAGPGARLAHRLTDRTQKYLFAGALLVMGPVIALKPYVMPPPPPPKSTTYAAGIAPTTFTAAASASAAAAVAPPAAAAASAAAASVSAAAVTAAEWAQRQARPYTVVPFQLNLTVRS